MEIMVELQQGNIEAFAFRSWGRVRVKPGRHVGYRIPGERALFVSRMINFCVLLCVIGLFVVQRPETAVVEVLLTVQGVHLLVKATWWWKPVYMDATRPLVVRPPRFTLDGEWIGYLASVNGLLVWHLINIEGPADGLSAVLLLVVFVQFYTGPFRGKKLFGRHGGR
ncbi:hypothetical protein [Oleiagrimonas soli]|uniref:Uncharacterized protein n=1 Tax=Oleiagrimonas soli TaxID=1543381 RepID=A0A099CU12_9GAMM|nr:hypothetical protein [Oleiagrimonas soli]KGI77087.1 hypothetical protein LF63_0112630 [Oleiagrimonas soli]MBB6185379.1 hypothetical protein [Oleiagrimonas soli]